MQNTLYIRQMEDWYRSNLGQKLTAIETAGLARILERIFGYYLLQMGGDSENNYLSESPIHHHIHVGPELVNLKKFY